MGSVLLLYALPSLAVQTCKDYIPDNTPNSRYTDNGNSTVTDHDTGLMWKQCFEGLTGADCTIGEATKHNWQEALALVTTVNLATFAGHADWRVPNITEITSLISRNCYSPAINITFFPDPVDYAVWSSSPGSSSLGSNGFSNAWSVLFYDGYHFYGYRDTNYLSVRLVRSMAL